MKFVNFLESELTFNIYNFSLAQSQQCKQHNNVLNLFNVNKKDTRTKSNECRFVVSIVDFGLISHIVLVLSWLIFKKQMPAG